MLIGPNGVPRQGAVPEQVNADSQTFVLRCSAKYSLTGLSQRCRNRATVLLAA